MDIMELGSEVSLEFYPLTMCAILLIRREPMLVGN